MCVLDTSLCSKGLMFIEHYMKIRSGSNKLLASDPSNCFYFLNYVKKKIIFPNKFSNQETNPQHLKTLFIKKSSQLANYINTARENVSISQQHNALPF